MKKIVITGFGFMGTMHAQVYSALTNASVAAIVDDDIAASQKKARDLGIDVPVYSDFDQAVKVNGIDIVDVCVPTPHHGRYVQRAISARKHVFCEKPLAATHREAAELAKAARDAGIIMQVGHCIRFWPEYQALEKYIKQGRGGKLRSLSLVRRSGRPNYSTNNWLNNGELSGGGAFDLHIHDTDYVLHLLGRPKAVTSVGTKDDTGWSHLFTSYHYDDIAVTSEGGWNYPEKWGFQMAFEAVFENAVIEFDSRANPTLMITENGSDRKPLAFEGPAVGEAKSGGGNLSSLGGYFNELQYFLDCVQNNRQPHLATPMQAADSVQTVLAEIESAATKRTVLLAQ